MLIGKFTVLLMTLVHQEPADLYKLIDLDIQINNVKDKYKEIYDFENTISLHFRLGDYKDKKHYHPILSVEYYINSLEYILYKNNDKSNIIWNVLYFYEENDKDIITKNICQLQKHFLNKLNFISINSDIVDYEQMLLMSLCKHNIIANSTFSWWGAYLNKSFEKIVCAPKIWFGKTVSHNTKDLYYPEWKII